jgi:hypothetical protein
MYNDRLSEIKQIINTIDSSKAKESIHKVYETMQKENITIHTQYLSKFKKLGILIEIDRIDDYVNYKFTHENENISLGFLLKEQSEKLFILYHFFIANLIEHDLALTYRNIIKSMYKYDGKNATVISVYFLKMIADIYYEVYS